RQGGVQKPAERFRFALAERGDNPPSAVRVRRFVEPGGVEGFDEGGHRPGEPGAGAGKGRRAFEPAPLGQPVEINGKMPVAAGAWQRKHQSAMLDEYRDPGRLAVRGGKMDFRFRPRRIEGSDPLPGV